MQLIFTLLMLVSLLTYNNKTTLDFSKKLFLAEEKLTSDRVSNYDTDYRDNSCLEENLNDNGLFVRIRPTLPRRQADTPTFSPTLAWRSLVEQQEHIDKSKIINTLNSWKPTTSESPIQLNQTAQMKQIAKPNYLLTNWTPEQDLVDENDDKIKGLITGDDSSSDEYRSKCEGDSLLFYGGKTNNVESSIHTFSLSLPRDSHTQHTRHSGNAGNVCTKNFLLNLNQLLYFFHRLYIYHFYKVFRCLFFHSISNISL